MSPWNKFSLPAGLASAGLLAVGLTQVADAQTGTPTPAAPTPTAAAPAPSATAPAAAPAPDLSDLGDVAPKPQPKQTQRKRPKRQSTGSKGADRQKSSSQGDKGSSDSGAGANSNSGADANSTPANEACPTTPETKARVKVKVVTPTSKDKPMTAEERRAAARKAAAERKRSQRAAKAACANAKKKVKSAKKANAKKLRAADGTPQQGNPSLSLATPGAAPIGVPNFMIDKFRIPPFLLPIYQAAGIEYGIRWEVLAAINEIETDYGRNLNISTAGALGWMQFMPATWDMYGVDANHDGDKDPYNPVDAIFAAARYLRAAGADTDLNKAIFAYNHADWYVDSVLMRAQLIGGLPANLVGSLTGLTQAHFPVYAKARYADDLSEAQATRRAKRGGNAAYLIGAQKNRRGINVYARAGAPVIAVNDGKVIRIGETARLGRFIQLQDAYGNTFTYGHLKKIPELYPARKPHRVTKEEIAREMELPAKDAAPTAPASGRTQDETNTAAQSATAAQAAAANTAAGAAANTTPAAPARRGPQVASKSRLFAHPARPQALAAGADRQLSGTKYDPARGIAGLTLDSRDVVAKPLRVGARVAAGTILGRIGRTSPTVAPHLLFEIRPAGRGAPRIDPKPILDGWKLLESTEIYRAQGRNPFHGADAAAPSIGQILLMSKEALVSRVLANPRIDIYQCGRQDIRAGIVDRRVLATLEFLAASGLKPTVTSLRCGHGYYTASGNVSQHSSGNAVDIAAINGIPILGNQGAGSITEIAVQRLLTLQGTMKPDQIITLMTFEGTDNTLAMADHADHIHVGWRPLFGTNSTLAKQVNAILKPSQWQSLIARLASIKNPRVRTQPSKYAVKTDGASAAQNGQ